MKLQVLDSGSYFLHGGEQYKIPGLPLVFLDGKGGMLPQGLDPVYLEIDADDLANGTARNSAGEFFDRYPEPEADGPVIVEGGT